MAHQNTHQHQFHTPPQPDHRPHMLQQQHYQLSQTSNSPTAQMMYQNSYPANTVVGFQGQQSNTLNRSTGIAAQPYSTWSTGPGGLLNLSTVRRPRPQSVAGGPQVKHYSLPSSRIQTEFMQPSSLMDQSRLHLGSHIVSNPFRSMVTEEHE